MLYEAYWRARGKVARAIEPRGLEDTSASVQLDEFGLDNPDWNYYAPSGWRWLRLALREMEVRDTDVFVDFGSGKGRVLLEAARHPFARVVGVEVSEQLNEVARRNLARRGHRFACRDVEVVTSDAADFVVPDDLTVAYLYNPFAGHTFDAVVRNMVESLDRRPRKVTVIYANPQMGAVLLASRRFRLVRTTKGGHREAGQKAGSLSIYESV